MTDAPVTVDDPTSPAAQRGVGGGVLEGDWPVRAADTVERVVDTVRSKTTGPAIVASRIVVYGVVGAVLAIIAVTLVVVALIRVLDVYLPRGVWLPYVILGAVLGLVGAVLWRQRRQTRSVSGGTMSDDRMHEVVIIGSGPAGLTAAVYTARANLAPLVLEGEPSSTSDQPGGQLMLTTDVENFPGFPDGVLGPDLMSRIHDQAARFGADLRMEKVSRVSLNERPFGIWVGDADAGEPTFRSRAVIVATGAQSLLLGLPGEQALIGHGVSTCATCDGFFFRDQDIAVVGGGDSALEEALFLTKFARSVTIVHRRENLRASKIMQDRAFANEKIGFRWNSVVEGIKGDGSVESTLLRDVHTGALDELVVTGLFVAIGHRPSTSLFSGMLDMDEAGYLRTEPGSTRTNIPGVFACGDVQDSTYRQAVTAAGSGCMAAIDAERWLEHLGHRH